MRKILAALFACFILLGMAAATQTSPPPVNAQVLIVSPGTPQRGSLFDYVVLIIMENHPLCSIVGSIVIGCYSSTIAPYETQLAQNYTLATDYTGVAHPSPPDYVALIGGSTFNMSSQCFPASACGSDHLCCPINAANIVDRFNQSGLTWKAYAEDYGGLCLPAGQELPFNYFSDIYDNPSRCKNIVSAGWPLNMTGNPKIFLNDLNSTQTASNFMWFSPSPCDQWHHLCTGYGATNQGDFYLSTVVPKILASKIFTTQRAALFVVYDEGYGKGLDTCPSGSGDCVYAVWAGPQVKQGYICGTRYSHYSFLATVEFNWGLQNLTSNDGLASPMTEFFTNGPPCKLQAGFTTNSSPNGPLAGQTMTFSGLVSGGTGPYSFTWNFGDGNSGVGQTTSHAYQKAGKYTATLRLTDEAGQTVTASRTLTIGSDPSFNGPTPPSGVCIECLFKDNPFATKFLIGVPVGFTLFMLFAAFLRRPRRKAIITLEE